MNNLLIEKTQSTPTIQFDFLSNVLKISGESFPENTAKFYSPVLEWLREYIEQLDSATEVTMEFNIIYFNSSTSKIFMTIFDMLEGAVENGKKICVNWRCDEKNETAIECGEEFKEDLDVLPFNLIIEGDQ
ncbi:MAG: DUF1987 domain-containing protein [Bacillota bacterium]|nr:DUF1987 domain-containing protein [Bacillota bacterium]MDP4159935.1 DUF1987 domain-containing protein [Bacillota bacterium]